jgi:AcrR family transcriptional regulator
MSPRSAESSSRPGALLDAAIEMFLRYGFRKASMGDVARAARISRQGLYLHFSTKEALFHAALQHRITQILEGAHVALTRTDSGVEQRLLDAFEALHAETSEEIPKARTSELLEAADAHGRELVAQFEREFVGAIASALAQSGVVERWTKFDISAKQLADHLFAIADGAHRLSDTRRAYRSLMRTAIRIVVKGA